MQVLASAKSDGVLDNFSMIVLDDGPSDALQELVPKKFPSVVFKAHHENMGFGFALLSLIKSCTTDYLMLTSDDDLLSLGGLQEAERYLSRFPCDLLSTQWLRNGQIHRGREEIRAVQYWEMGAATRHAPGLIFRVDTAKKYLDIMEELFRLDNFAAKMYPQVMIAYLALLEGGELRWHTASPVSEGFAAASQLGDSDGNSYWSLLGRMKEFQGFLDFFEWCTSSLDSVRSRDLAANLRVLWQQELFTRLSRSIETDEEIVSFRGAAFIHSLRSPWRGISAASRFVLSRKRAHRKIRADMVRLRDFKPS